MLNSSLLSLNRIGNNNIDLFLPNEIRKEIGDKLPLTIGEK